MKQPYLFKGDLADYVQAMAESMPFADAEFDLVHTKCGSP
jgi:ubiquinone/menaquinone biosynthesis C-methylase UbiE